MAKLHDTDPERLHDQLRLRLRELTAECRRLREELRKSTQERIAGNRMVHDRSVAPAPRRRRPARDS